MVLGMSGQVKRVITAVVGLIIVLSILGTTIGDVMEDAGDVNEQLTDNASDLNESTSENLAPTFAILIGLSVLLAIVGLVLRAADVGGGGPFG